MLSEEETETGTRVTRQVKFDKDVRGDADSVVETVVNEFAPSRVYFHQPDGSNIFNLVSYDQAGNLIMTYAFEWRHPELEGGNERVEEMREKYLKVSHARLVLVCQSNLLYRWPEELLKVPSILFDSL